MKIPKNIQYIAAGITAIGVLYLGYLEYSKFKSRINTIERNITILHSNIEQMVNQKKITSVPTSTGVSSNITTTISTKKDTTTNKKVNFQEPEHIRLKKQEIANLEQQLENYESDEEDVSDSEYTSDDESEEVTDNEITNLDPENSLLEDSLNELVDSYDIDSKELDTETTTHEEKIEIENLVESSELQTTDETTMETPKQELDTFNMEIMQKYLNYDNDTELVGSLKKIKVAELRTILKQCGLSTLGKKKELMDRLVDHKHNYSTQINVSE